MAASCRPVMAPTHPSSRRALGQLHWLIVLGTLGCAEAGPGGNGSPAASSVADGGATTSAGSGADEGATGGQDSDFVTSEGSASEGGNPGGSSDGGAADAGESSTGPGGSSSDGGGAPPADLWELCQTDTDCSSGACIVVSINGEIHPGFCSNPDCSNANVDCSPPQVGNATPICIDVMDQVMGTHSVCALDCSGGSTCPPGLVCVPEVGSICVTTPS